MIRVPPVASAHRRPKSVDLYFLKARQGDIVPVPEHAVLNPQETPPRRGIQTRI